MINMDQTSYSKAEFDDFYQTEKIHITDIESFSRKPFLQIVPDQTTKWVVEFIKNILVEFLELKLIKTDNGLSFKSHDVRNLCAEFGITQSFTFPYNPRANGPIERSHA